MSLKSELKILKRLSKLKLRQPKGIRRFIWEQPMYYYHTYSGYDCVEVIEKWNDTLILRVFAYNRLEKSGINDIKILEVMRKVLGCKKYLSSTCVTSSMNGRRIYWDEEPGFTVVSSNWEFSGTAMYDHQKIINELNIPYCSYDKYFDDTRYVTRLHFIDYLTTYINEPRIERLVKLGLSKYIPSLRYLDLSQRRIYKVFKLEKKWEKYIGDLDIGDLIILRNKEINSIRQLKIYRHVYRRDHYGVGNIRESTELKQLLKYCDKENITISDLSIYNDYLRFVDELGYDKTRNDVLYPKDLKSVHDGLLQERNRLKEEIELEEAAKNQSKFYEQYLKNLDHKLIGNKFVIEPVKSQTDLIEESKILNHCVRIYADQVMSGNTEILLLREKSKPTVPLYTIEVRNNKVLQARGKNNTSIIGDAKDFLIKWSNEKGVSYAS